MKAVSIKSIKKIGERKVRNLCVEKNHTFITSNGIITHNCDRAKPHVQDSWKVLIEEFSKSASFIFISNHKNKIISAVQSRLQCIDFKVSHDETRDIKIQFYRRVIEILKLEEVEYSKEVVANVVDKVFPDMRQVLNELQKYHQQGIINDPESINRLSADVSKFFEILKSRKFVAARQYMANITDSQGFYSVLSEESVKYIKSDSLVPFTMFLAKYMYQTAFMTDNQPNLMAFICECWSEDVQVKETV